MPLWEICCDVEDELGAEDAETNLQSTLVVVRELLKRGLIAGASPVHQWGSDPDFLSGTYW